jgi:CheY-like chemotaxis protein
MYILILDDESVLLSLYRTILEGEGHKVEVATSGKDAFEIIRRRGVPPLILLDCSMPDMSGEKFVDHFSQEGLDRSRSVILGFSSFSPSAPTIASFIGKVDQYLEKPESVEEFLQKVGPYLPKVVDP